MAIDLEAYKAACLIDCVDENGEKTKIHINDHVQDGFVLIVGGSKKYHINADCFHYWDDRLQEKFKGWEKISLAEAERRKLTKCRLCEHLGIWDEDNEE